MASYRESLTNNATCLVNLSNSILSHYGAEVFHPVIKEFDKLFSGHKKIALFLFDGLGRYPLEVHRESAKFILDHEFMVIDSVNPPTTAAATNSLLTGKFPIETGWLGWAPYIEEVGAPVALFPNRYQLSDEPVEGWNMRESCPLITFRDLLSKAGVKVKELYPRGIHLPGEPDDGPKSLRQMEKDSTRFFKEGGEFLYGYWTEPDECIHKNGVASKEVGRWVKKINRMVERFVKDNPDVLVLTLADHGLVDVEYVDVAPIREISDNLIRPLSNEGRCACLYVKQGKIEEVMLALAEHFPDFIILKKEEVLEKQYFGEGLPNPKSLGMIGDIVAISTGRILLYNSKDGGRPSFYKAHHAGGMKEEKEILVAAYNV